MFRISIISLSLSALASFASAGDLIFSPVNPAFGGNPNNFDYLVGTAQIQNQHPADPGGGGGGGGVPNINFPDISIDLGGAVAPAAPAASTLAAPLPSN